MSGLQAAATGEVDTRIASASWQQHDFPGSTASRRCQHRFAGALPDPCCAADSCAANYFVATTQRNGCAVAPVRCWARSVMALMPLKIKFSGMKLDFVRRQNSLKA